MKLPLLKTTFAALAGVFLTQGAHAATYTASSEDLILSVYDASQPPKDTSSLQVDLGSITQFDGSGTPFVPLSLTTDLTNNFGAGYYTNGNLIYSVVGVNNTGAAQNGYKLSSIFISDPTSTAFDAESKSGLGNALSQIGGLYTPGAASPGVAPRSDIVANGAVNSYNNERTSGNFGLSGADAEAMLDMPLYLDVLQPGSGNLGVGTSALVSTAGRSGRVHHQCSRPRVLRSQCGS